MRRWFPILAAFVLFVLIGTYTAKAADTQQVVAVCGTPTGLTYPVPGLGNVTINTAGQLCATTVTTPNPGGGTSITGVFSGADTASAAATLAGTAGKTTYICGFTVSGLGSTAGGPVTVTVATLAGGNTLSYSYVFAASATTANTPLSFTYNPCVPASAAATAITITVPGQAGNTATQINATGFQL